MPNPQAPGIYFEEVPSAVKPIAGVGTSTAGFIGLVQSTSSKPVNSKVSVDRKRVSFDASADQIDFLVRGFPEKTLSDFSVRATKEGTEVADLSVEAVPQWLSDDNSFKVTLN
ncbi:MAG: hypothetical protein K8J31_20540, partial [Anaerolineae bacterium]|nr:hypothetical protein [Anaerolineae bacterium]